jgi:hypothetical protein
MYIILSAHIPIVGGSIKRMKQKTENCKHNTIYRFSQFRKRELQRHFEGGQAADSNDAERELGAPAIGGGVPEPPLV